MTTDAAAAAPAQPPAAPAQPPDPAAPAASATLDERMTTVETEQRRQGGILERIEAALTGGGGGRAAEPVNVADAVQQGIEKIRSKERRDKEAADKATEAEEWKKSVETRLSERRPAAPATGTRAKIARALFGAPDER